MKFRPQIDRLFWIIFIPIELLLCGTLALSIVFYERAALLIMTAVFLFANYFFLSPLFGYAELLEEELFIKYGFILKRRIPYSKIRAIEKKRRWYSESMLSLKMSVWHIDIKYNRFDVTSLSLKDEERFITILKEKTNMTK